MAHSFNSDSTETLCNTTFQDSLTEKPNSLNMNVVSVSETQELQVQEGNNNNNNNNTHHVPRVTDDEFSNKGKYSLGNIQETLSVNMTRNISENSNVGISANQDNNFHDVHKFAIVLADDESSKNQDSLLAADKSTKKDGKSLILEQNMDDGSSQDSQRAAKAKEGVSLTHEYAEESTKNDGLLDGDKQKSSNLEGNLSSKDDENNGSVKCTVKIEVIDDTAVVDVSQLGGKRIINRLTKNNAIQENGETNVPRKAYGTNTVVEAKEKNVLIDGEKRAYSRKELEDLRFIGMEEQRKKWLEVYCGLGDAVQKEYDGLLHSSTVQKKQKEYDGLLHSNTVQKNRRYRGKENAPVSSGNDTLEHLDDQERNIAARNSPLAYPLSRDDGISYEEGESNAYEETDDSDDDYNSIQRPAFVVTGDPDFDSGPPEDGLEFLRRVRWEAAQLPKVKVVKIEGSKPNKEQTCYMPQIPDIASCQEHLLPLKEWEEAFLADFSELRQALSRLEANVETSSQLHSATCVHQEHSSNQLPEGIVLDKFDGLMSGEDESCLSDAGDDPTIGKNSIPKSSPAGGFGNSPTLSVILRMDAVSRVSMLRKRITAVQSTSLLSTDDCLWLFALCAAVDTPLDANTCAALRSLLRKCASLRAEKSKLDDEVIMLNMLATISGRYFGQSGR